VWKRVLWRIEARLEPLDVRLGELERRLPLEDHRLDEVEPQLGAVQHLGAKVTAITSGLASLDEALDFLLWRLRDVQDQVAATSEEAAARSDRLLQLLNERSDAVLQVVNNRAAGLLQLVNEVQNRIVDAAKETETFRVESRNYAFMLRDNTALIRAQLYAGGLQIPLNLKAKALKKAFDEYSSGNGGEAIVVEIGCMRYPYESPTEGASTLHLARWCSKHGRRFVSIDVEAEDVRNARNVLASEGHQTTLIVGDGAAILGSMRATIGLLFLDGSNDPREALEQFRAAEQKLAPSALVVVDDIQPIEDLPLGKGTKLLPVVEGEGWQVDTIPTEPGYLMAILRRGAAESA
jgi:hypothetical protein